MGNASFNLLRRRYGKPPEPPRNRKAVFQKESTMLVVNDYNEKMQKTIAKFVHNNLPEAKKPYSLITMHQEALDLHGVASKADAYGIGTDPKVIEQGLEEGMKLIAYLVMDGWRVRAPLFNLRIRVPGEYDGTETELPEGVHPVVRLRASSEFRKYVKEHVRIEIDGVAVKNGLISAFLDIDENVTNSIFVPGDQFKLTGTDIMAVGGDPSVGVYFTPVDSPAHAVRVTRIARNSRSEIIGICPQTGYQRNKIVVKTQYYGSTVKFLKTVKTIESSFVIEEA